MEDWEVAPGRIFGTIHLDKDEDEDEDAAETEVQASIAWSSSYLRASGHGVKLPGVQFDIINVPAGLSYSWDKAIPGLRVCSVASGKVQVQIGKGKEKQEFAIGANGMWRIRAREKCVVVNKHYSEAVVHISTIVED